MTDKRQQALDKKAENARELGLDYEPAQQEPVGKVTETIDGAFKCEFSKPLQKGALLYTTPPAQQEPVAWLKVIETPGGWGKFVEAKPNEKGAKPVYTSPPAQRTWVGLTDEELSEVYNQADWDTVNGWEYERAIEAKLKEKNT